MLKQYPDQYKTPAEIAEKTDITEEEIWRRLGTGQWPAVALGEVFDTNGEFSHFDYTAVSAEVVRRIIAQNHEQIEYKTNHKTVVVQARKDLIQVLTGPDFTPELFDTENNRLTSQITSTACPEPQPAAKYVTTINKLRSNSIDAPIKKAVEKAKSTDTGTVFLELRELAINGEKPFTGIVEGDALFYTNDNNKLGKFTKNALDHRLRTMRKPALTRG